MFNQALSQCTKCGLYRGCQGPVPGQGPNNARIVIIGEAPGRQEDEQKKPFVGESGLFLNTLLENVGLKREKVYVTNVVKCRPPNNGDPTVTQARECGERWLARE